MSIENKSSPTTQYAAQNDATFGFCGKSATISMVAVPKTTSTATSQAVASYAHELVCSLGNTGSIVKEGLKGAAIGGAAGLAALGAFDALAVGVGGMAAAAGFVLGGRGPSKR